MNKPDFIAAIADRVQGTKAEAARYLNAVLETIVEVFENEDTLRLLGFASFGVKTRAAHTGRNPHSGKKISIPERKVPFVRMSAKIKEQLNIGKARKSGKPRKKKT